MKYAFLFFIAWYQKIFSPDHGLLSIFFPYGFCRFYPSCSQYAADVIARYGAVRGVLKGVYRLMRCNPWNSGGIELFLTNQNREINLKQQ